MPRSDLADQCPCGAAIPADADYGLCPECLQIWDEANDSRLAADAHAQAVKDGDKAAIGEDLLSRADQLKSEMKDRGEW